MMYAKSELSFISNAGGNSTAGPEISIVLETQGKRDDQIQR